MSSASQMVPSASADPEWSILHQGTIYGPYSRKDLLKLILSKQINAKVQLKRSDWNEFCSIIDCLETLSKDPAAVENETTQPLGTERRVAAPRTGVSGLVQIASESGSIVSIGSNISTTGLFVKTGETSFKIGENVQLNAKLLQIPKQFNAKAEIMRYSTSLKFGVGYGMRFLEIDNVTVAEISRVVGVRPIAEFGEVYSAVHLVPKPPK